MFNLNIFTTRVKKSLLYDNVSKSKTDYYNSHNIFANNKSMNLLLNGILTKEVDHNIERYLSIKNIDFSSKLNINKIIKDKINFTKHIDGFNDYKVLFFRKTIESSMVLTQLHIYNGELLYANSSFTYLGEDEEFRRLILLELSFKYDLDIDEDLLKDVVVEDSKDNRLMIVDNGRLVLHYVSGNDALLTEFALESGTDIKAYVLNHVNSSLIANVI